MQIRDIMTTNLEIAEPDDTLDDIAGMMRDHDVGAIPVVEEGELIGIVTDRDIVLRCVAEGRDPGEVAVDEIITGDVETISPDADVNEAWRIMADRQVRRLPVVENERLVGMVSLGDLAVKTADEQQVAEALEEISEGVKATDQSAAQRAPRRSGEQGGRPPSLHDRIEEQDQGVVQRKQRTEGQVQGIASHAAKEEVARQNRVVSIRTEQKAQAQVKRAKPSTRRKTG